jgi:exosortase/archaeosortase family protein
LTTILLFLWSKKTETSAADSRLLLPTLFTLLYVATFPFLPPLLRAAIAVTAIGCALSSFRLGVPFHLGICGLLLLSLPVVSSLQFYLGYPLRVLTGALTAPLLQLTGFPVVREGTCLNWSGELVWIDAPCSGVRMLWAGLYLAFTLACFYELNARRTFFTVTVALLSIVFGNVLRSAALFYVEAGVITCPSWTHPAIGIITFAFTAAFIVLCVQQFRRKELQTVIASGAKQSLTSEIASLRSQ